LKRRPWHESHSTFTSGRKFISMVCMPWPSQAGSAPRRWLKLKRLVLYPAIFASVVFA
jgi:hypothetical protein